MRSRDKLKTCLHHHSTYGHQTRPGHDIQWGISTDKVTFSFRHAVLWAHLTNLILNISIYARNHGKVVTYCRELPPINSNNALNHVVRWGHVTNKKHQTYQGGELPRGAPTEKFAWLLNEVVSWCHVTNLIYCISACRGSIGTKLDKVLTHHERHHPLN